MKTIYLINPENFMLIENDKITFTFQKKYFEKDIMTLDSYLFRDNREQNSEIKKFIYNSFQDYYSIENNKFNFFTDFHFHSVKEKNNTIVITFKRIKNKYIGLLFDTLFGTCSMHKSFAMLFSPADYLKHIETNKDRMMK